MNTASRYSNQGTLSRGFVISIIFSKSHFSSIVLMLGVIISALSIVYVTNTSRSLYANMQQMLAERNRMHVEWGQLLLEKSTWTMQARVQRIAESNLGMEIPNHKSVVIVNE